MIEAWFSSSEMSASSASRNVGMRPVFAFQQET